MYVNNVTGVYTVDGNILAQMISDDIKLELVKTSQSENTNLNKYLYDKLHNDAILYHYHKQYCTQYNKYDPNKYPEIPFSNNIKMEVHSVLTSVLIFEVCSFRIRQGFIKDSK